MTNMNIMLRSKGTLNAHVTIMANSIVKEKSTRATPMNLNLCAPVPGYPKMSLYCERGHNVIYITK
jgi:hypothetical protein